MLNRHQQVTLTQHYSCVYILQDGYRTVIGEGTGFSLSHKATLQLALARALLKRPKLLLLGGVEQLVPAVGMQRLLQILQQQLAGGSAVLMTAVAEDGSAEYNKCRGDGGVFSLVNGLGVSVQRYRMAGSRLQQCNADVSLIGQAAAQRIL